MDGAWKQGLYLVSPPKISPIQSSITLVPWISFPTAVVKKEIF